MSRSLSKRAATALLRQLTGSLWGAPPMLIGEIVDRLGAVSALAWFAKNLPPYEFTMRKWDPARTHLLCMEASLLNGCAYCAHAHALAFQLHHFKNEGKPFPLDEHGMVALRDGNDEELRAALTRAFHDGKLPEDSALFDELWQLRFSGKEPVDDRQRRIRHILNIFDMLNYCGIDAQTPFDHAHDPINKDEDLKRRYAEARLVEVSAEGRV